VNKFTRFPDWGYEVGVELIMDILVREEEHEMAQLMNNLSFDRKYSQGLQWLNKRLTGVSSCAGMPPDTSFFLYMPTHMLFGT
jgi:hypothetical protein